MWSIFKIWSTPSRLVVAAIGGALALMSASEVGRFIVPAQAQSSQPASPTPTQTTQTGIVTGPNGIGVNNGSVTNNDSHNGPITNNLGPCSGASGSSRPDCSKHVQIIRNDENAGTLLAANDKQLDPDHCGQTAKRKFTVYFGSGAYIPAAFPATVFRVNGENVLSLDKLPNGRVAINLEIWGDDERILASIVDGKWHVNPNAVFYKDTPDRSTLTVYDQHNKRVLTIRYNSPKFITISGTLRYQNNSIGMLDDGTVLVGNAGIQGYCITSLGGAAISIGPDQTSFGTRN
jgi:hypothetical protein